MKDNLGGCFGIILFIAFQVYMIGVSLFMFHNVHVASHAYAVNEKVGTFFLDGVLMAFLKSLVWPFTY